MTTPDNVEEITEPPAPEKPVLEVPNEIPAVETPAPEPTLESTPKPTPEPETSQPSTGERRLQQENAALRQARAAQQQDAMRRQAWEGAAARAQQWVQQGQMTPEQAQLVTQELQQYQEHALTQQYQLQGYAQHLTGKNNAAAHYAAKYGMSHKELMQFDSPQAMEAHAKGKSEIASLKTDMAKMKKAGVPAQKFGNEVTQPTGGELEGEALEIAVGNGTIEFTPAVAERLIKYQKSQGFGG